ncbi:MAG: lytic murein transglycosylase [Rhodospirillales bacterium]|nr:lytic murein transglycosylase [Rhodospirillales bacterium]
MLPHRTLPRRTLLAGIGASLVPAAAFAASSGEAGFAAFLNAVRNEARRDGIRNATLSRALDGLRPDPAVLARAAHQPEFTMTWARYRGLLISDQRITNGRAAEARVRGLLARISARYSVAPGVILGIWGVESSFGTISGQFQVVRSLATLGASGHRSAFFRSELIDALRILDAGDITAAHMLGSYAGAMGQPQFMPSSYLHYAVDFDGSGRRDIWNDTADVLASIANYLARSGWRRGEPWGQRVVLPLHYRADGPVRRSVGDWHAAGIRAGGGRGLAPAAMPARLLLPDGIEGAAAGEAYLVYPNFNAIRRYNPSDFYALAVGLIGDRILGI